MLRVLYLDDEPSGGIDWFGYETMEV